MYLISTDPKTLGNIGVTISGLIDGFNYRFSTMIAIAFKKVLKGPEKLGHHTKELTDSYIM